MERGTAPSFANAGIRHRELSPRQIEVLRLVAEGRTNREIGEALGITVDGAKLNVSELLTKLGLDSREELAGYWRWHNRRSARVGRAFRGLLSLPVIKIAGGLGTVALVGGVALGAFAVFGNDGGTPARRTIPPFEMVARIAASGSTAVGTSIAGGSPSPVPESDRTTTVFHWYFLDRTHFRYDVESIQPALDATTMTIAYAGKKVTTYYASSNTYSVSPYDVPDDSAIPPALSALMGPISYPDIPAMLDAFRNAGSPPRTAEIVGEEVVLGRQTKILEISPIAESTSNGVITRSGTLRVWVDPERMFAMRSISGGDILQAFTVEVTSLQYDLPPGKVNASFTPPPGAKEVPAGSNFGSVGSGGGSSVPVGSGTSVMRVPTGFLTAAHLPEGYAITGDGSETASGSNETISVNTTLTDGTDDTVRIEQRKRPDGLPDSLRTTDTTTINGRTAYRETDGIAKTLAWDQDGVSILITASALPYPELERIATSMTIQ
ncbi:MAG: helix-turn-helix transcriptional regulator [Tepidiformaceae bacterium]